MFYRIFLILVFSMGSIFANESEHNLTICANCEENSQPSSNLSPYKGGKYITSRDTLNVLAVFISFKDDTVWKAGDKYWDTLSAPTFLHTLFDSKDAYPSDKYNLSNFFRTMSWTAPNKADRFHLIGDGVFYVTPHTRDWYKNRGMELSDINAETLRRLDDSLHIDFSKYDNWVFGRDHNHSKKKDSYVDMIYMIYRNVYLDNISKYKILVDKISLTRNWSGNAGLIFPDTIHLPVSGMNAKGKQHKYNSSGITMIRFPYNLTSSDGRAMGSFVHELGHFFGFAHRGDKSTVPCLMNTGNQAYFSVHPYEREYLKWANYNTVSSKREIILDDYITSGDAIKINTHSSDDKYVYITNHQLESQFDVVNGNHPDSSSGVYISGNYDILRLLSAAGNYNWKHMGMIPNPWDNNFIPIWRDTLENPTGDSPRDKLRYFTPSGTKRWSYLHAYYDNDGKMDNTIHRCFGKSEDAFNDSDKFMISSYTNPSLLAYGGNKEGLSVEVTDYSNGKYTIKVRFDSTDTIDDLPPFRPMNLKSNYVIGYGLMDHSVDLSWDVNQESDVIHYQVWRSVNKSSGYTKIKDNVSTNSYTDLKPLQSSTGFLYYKVKAVDDDAKISTYSRYSKVDIKPSAPSCLSYSWNDKYPKLQWSYCLAPDDFEEFEVWKKADGSTSWQLEAMTTNTYWIDENEEEWNRFQSSYNVFYMIRTLDEGENRSDYSDTLSVNVDDNEATKFADSVSKDFVNVNEYALYDNFPNPFNPSTTIVYSIPKSSKVEIVIYNLAGQKIETLVNREHSSGKYQVSWNGSHHASGVYIYQIEADNYTLSKKMMLIK